MFRVQTDCLEVALNGPKEQLYELHLSKLIVYQTLKWMLKRQTWYLLIGNCSSLPLEQKTELNNDSMVSYC